MQVGSLFPTTGLQGFPAESLRPFEFFPAGCRRSLVITGARYKAQSGGLGGTPRGNLNSSWCPAGPGDRPAYICSKLFQMAEATAQACITVAGPIGRRLLHHREVYQETTTRRKGILELLSPSLASCLSSV